MTNKQELHYAERAAEQDVSHPDGKGVWLSTVKMHILRALCVDSHLLRELREKLPKCELYVPGLGHVCGNLATREETGGMCDDFNRLFWCDEHGEEAQRGGDVCDTDWADVVRRMGE